MSDKVWDGWIFLKEEGGYEIVFRALKHYKKRLMKIDQSPELRDSAAMFGGILRQAALKTIPNIDEIDKKIKLCLTDSIEPSKLIEDIPILEKALTSYETDINKARDSGHEYYLGLIGNLSDVKNDLELIKAAKLRINQFN